MQGRETSIFSLRCYLQAPVHYLTITATKLPQAYTRFRRVSFFCSLYNLTHCGIPSHIGSVQQKGSSTCPTTRIADSPPLHMEWSQTLLNLSSLRFTVCRVRVLPMAAWKIKSWKAPVTSNEFYGASKIDKSLSTKIGSTL